MPTIVYIRKSPTPVIPGKTEGQLQRSMEQQKEECLRYCDSRGISVEITEIIDSETSGGIPIRQRESGKQLAEILDNAEYNYDVVIYALDRLSRCPDYDQSDILAWMADGHKFHVVNHGGCITDGTTAVGRFLFRQLMNVSALEKEQLRERVSRGVRAAVKAGKPIGGAKFGYVIGDDGYLQPCEEEYPILLEMVDMRDLGYGNYQIAEQLNARGIPTKRGNKWSSAAVKKIVDRFEEAREEELYEDLQY